MPHNVNEAKALPPSPGAPGEGRGEGDFERRDPSYTEHRAPVTVTVPASAPVLRILDANANRAREALRVLEDFTRFAQNNPTLSESLKHLRHNLATATAPWDAQAILTRDTEHDIGTTIKTPTELHRENPTAVVIAAGKRLGEALRSLEEFAKIIAPNSAKQLEQLRYRFYTIEQQLHQSLHPKAKFAQVRLYVLITESACRRPWQEVAQATIAGGADCLQLREKNLDGAELLTRAKTLVALAHKNNVLAIINDRVDIAMLSNADGVHLGQTDLPATEARKLLGPEKIIGVSTHHIDQARQAQRDGADYVGVGPVFPSPTKPRNILPGLDYVRQVAKEIQIPAIAIAGITKENVEQVLNTGVKAVAITAAISSCDDVEAATKRLRQKLLAAVDHRDSAGKMGSEEKSQ